MPEHARPGGRAKQSWKTSVNNGTILPKNKVFRWFRVKKFPYALLREPMARLAFVTTRVVFSKRIEWDGAYYLKAIGMQRALQRWNRVTRLTVTRSS